MCKTDLKLITHISVLGGSETVSNCNLCYFLLVFEAHVSHPLQHRTIFFFGQIKCASHMRQKKMPNVFLVETLYKSFCREQEGSGEVSGRSHRFVLFNCI